VKDYSVLDQPEGTTGIAICRDMDYPNPARTYGEDSVGLLLVPAWDFDDARSGIRLQHRSLSESRLLDRERRPGACYAVLLCWQSCPLYGE
jgi:predicted amidohydrolase